MFSCGGSGDVKRSVFEQGECFWTRASGYKFDQDATATNAGVEETGYGLAMGGQFAIAEEWRLGFSIGYEQADADFTAIASSDIERFQIGVSAKRFSGPYTLSMALTGGHANFDTTRIVSLPSSTRIAESDNNQQNISGRMINSYTFDREGYYIEPSLSLDLLYVRRGDIEETGAGALNKIVDASDEFLFSAAPKVEVGKWFGEGRFRWKSFANVGAEVNANTSFAVQSRFEGAPIAVAPLTVTNEFDRWAAIYEAGLEVPITGKFDLRLGFNGRASANSIIYSGAAKLRWNF
ncbi:MAG: autotransporter outer membrane beta-barrel domain-containing protein [Pseudomonadota bacterium]